MVSVRWTAVSAVWVFLLVSAGCGSVPVSVVRSSGGGDPGVPVRGLTACGEVGGELELDAARPLVLFVPEHGDPGTRYRELAWRFEREGRQTACFGHDDRESLEESSRRLIQVIEELESRLEPSRIVVIGHSLGGLIARRALTQDRPDALPAGGFTYALVTVAAPFGGIRSSADCGRAWLHALTLGTSALLCNLVAGGMWTEIPPGSVFIRRPGTLLPEVKEEIQVVTDERGACQRRAWDGSCLEPDRVFSVGEQRNPAIERDPRLLRVEVAAGHAEILGQAGIPPAKLIAVLERQRILTTPGRVAASAP
jgi:pimeloyl-ACP methyl ester carboxylesterase